MLVLHAAEGTMPSRYLSFRCSVPWLLLVLQTLFLIRSFFDSRSSGGSFSPSDIYPGKAGTLQGKEGWSLLLLCPAQGWESAEFVGAKDNFCSLNLPGVVGVYLD